MILTTATIEGRPITVYNGIVVHEAIVGTDIARDLFARATNIVGGRSGECDDRLHDRAKGELENGPRGKAADAVVGVGIDYAIISGSTMMVSVSGTAVSLG